ncbi:MAG: carboxypeptidase-like regulatory domain-containing protein [Pseudomonadota bacterium]
MPRAMLKSLSLLLGALVSGAAQAQDPAEVPCEYGPPPMLPDEPPDEPFQPHFPAPPVVTIAGQVVQAGTGLPLEGIEVEIGEREVQTDTDGRFSIEVEGPLTPGSFVTVEAEDEDGKAHGGKHRPGKLVLGVDPTGQLPQPPEGGLIITLDPR